MKYAAELYFDAQTEEKLNRLIRLVAQEGISTDFADWQSRPHLTLATLTDVDEAVCMDKIRRFALAHEAIPAYLGSVGMFTDTRTVFASPIMHEGMYALHRDLHRSLAGMDMRGGEWYTPGRWVPHCTLALLSQDGEEKFLQACQLILKEFEKTAGSFESIGLVRVTKPVQEILTAQLR